MKKVSIVIPTFNQCRYLTACVDHCLHQTWNNLQLIIVDGGSTDETAEYLDLLPKVVAESRMTPVSHMAKNGEIVRNTIQTYPQNREIEIVRLKEDPGITETYNEGFRRVTGDYCTYIVGDDLPHPHMIEVLAKELDANPQIDFVYSDMWLVDNQHRILRTFSLPDFDFDQCLAHWYHLGVSHLYKSELHKKFGLMNPRYQSANDYDHYLRFALGGAVFKHIPRVLYSIRHHGENRQTGQHTAERYRRLLEESKECAQRAREWLYTKTVND